MLNALINQHLGRYTITALLGHGGMAAVYRAHDAALHRDIAIKVLYPQYVADKTLVERFKREAITAAALDHPNVVPIYDVGEEQGVVFIAMKLFSGPALQEVLNERGTLPLEDLLPLLEQVAAALDYAHTQDIVHRDIKPGNILLEFAPAAPPVPRLDSATAHLSDFGIAKVRDTPGLTTTGALIGTPDYMAPEQIGNRVVDGRADIYALGMLVFRALTGQCAFTGSTQEVLMAHLYQPPPVPSTLNPVLAPAIDAVLLRVLAKNPDERYPTAGVLVQALQQALAAPTVTAAHPYISGPTAATYPSSVTQTTQVHPSVPASASSTRPRRWLIWVPLVAVLLLLVMAGGLALAFRDDANEPQRGAGIISTETTEPTVPGGATTTLPATDPAILPTDTAGAAATGDTPTVPAPTAPAPTEPTATTAPPTSTTVPPATAAPPPPPTHAPTAVPPPPPPPTRAPTETPVPTSTPVPPPPPTDPPPPPPPPTAIPCARELLQGGFGKLYDENVGVREKVGCPVAAERAGRAVVQFFAGGSMYWWEPTDTIYIFFNVNAGNYRAVGSAEAAELLAPTPDPDNPMMPVRGFGRVYSGIPGVAAALGAPLTPEIILEPYGVRQDFTQGLMLFTPTYIAPPDTNFGKTIFVLYADNTFVRYNDTYQD